VEVGVFEGVTVMVPVSVGVGVFDSVRVMVGVPVKPGLSSIYHLSAMAVLVPLTFCICSGLRTRGKLKKPVM
jgi:hypothetical protein